MPSTDETPEVSKPKAGPVPGSSYHLRRDVGGQGKAQTLNHGLERVMADDLDAAVLFMDSELIYDPTAPNE